MSINNMCEVNLSNPEEFDQYVNLLDDSQADNYGFAFAPYKKEVLEYPDDFFSNARYIIYANPSFARTYCCCGMKSKRNRSGNCCKRHFCPKCAWYHFQNAYEPFAHSFYKGTFQHLTLSYHGYLAVGGDCTAMVDMEVYWKAAGHALAKAFKKNLIRGGAAACEVHIQSYLPMLLNPHVHAIVEGEPLTEDTLTQISTWMKEYLEKELDDDEQEGGVRQPDLKVVPIEDQKQLKNTFSYILKPILLDPAYRSTWNDKVADQPRLLIKLNSQLKDFVVGWSTIRWNQKLTWRFGSMHMNSKYYIGDVDKDKAEDGKEQMAA